MVDAVQQTPPQPTVQAPPVPAPQPRVSGGLADLSPPGPYAFDAYAGTGIGPVDTWAGHPLPGSAPVTVASLTPFPVMDTPEKTRAAYQPITDASNKAGHESPIDKHLAGNFDIDKDGKAGATQNASAKEVSTQSGSTAAVEHLSTSDKQVLTQWAAIVLKKEYSWLLPKNPADRDAWLKFADAVNNAGKTGDWSLPNNIAGRSSDLGQQTIHAMNTWNAYWQAHHQKAPQAPTSFADVRNLGLLKLEADKYVTSGAYDRDVSKVLAEAKDYVLARAGQVENPAIVLDIDETSLRNYEGEIKANDYGYDGKKAAVWEHDGNAPAIGPTLELFKAAKAHHPPIAVFFVTGRADKDGERNATATNLQRAGYVGYDGLFLKPADMKTNSVSEFKGPQRAKIEAMGYDIIANVGDQESDLAGGHADRAFKVPNPFYFLK